MDVLFYFVYDSKERKSRRQKGMQVERGVSLSVCLSQCNIHVIPSLGKVVKDLVLRQLHSLYAAEYV